MIDEICSIHLLTRAIIDSPLELKEIFNNCNEFFGTMYIYKITNKNYENSNQKNITVIVTNMPNLDVYDKIELLKISSKIEENKEYTNNIIEWKNKTIYIKKNDNDDYEYMNFFDIFPSTIENIKSEHLISSVSLKVHFDFNKNRFMFSDKKSGPHFSDEEISDIIYSIKKKKNPFGQTPPI